jgi:hypothetical protein
MRPDPSERGLLTVAYLAGLRLLALPPPSALRAFISIENDPLLGALSGEVAPDLTGELAPERSAKSLRGLSSGVPRSSIAI